ncbi:MAG TPA: GAF domain-containing sensor histidine kinase [Candidatus Limnocylindria bacterium]|nr:GAF domain-containing sensor histidine kinase [Candidatus Limnocylindria bacterium]
MATGIQRTRSVPSPGRTGPSRGARRLAELEFLAEVARLVGSARTWDELMGTIVDRATAAAQAEVCSLYLLDRDGAGVTLAATNGLDPEQIGVARLPLGVGITGIVAQTREPTTSLDVKNDERFHWLRAVDQLKFTSMCSVPLIWNDQVVGVLNVQTERRRRFSRQDVAFLEALAGMLAGIVERNRLQREAEVQLESLRAIDEARAHLVAVVTHALRTPLAVVRAYVELLGGATKRMAGRDEASEASAWERSALEQVDRLDQTVDSILASLRVLTPDSGPVVALDVADVVDDMAREMAPMFRRQKLTTSFVDRPLRAYASVDQLKRLLGYLLENAAKYAPSEGTIDVYGWRKDGRTYLAITDDGPGIPAEWRERIFEPFVRLDDSPRGSGIGLFAARHLARSMGGELLAEDRAPRGSQFVLRLPSAR